MQKGNKVSIQDKPVTGKNSKLCGELPRDTSLEPLLEIIRKKHGESILAILAYGSWLRGQRDTMLDLYVLVEDYQTLDSAWQGWLCRLLPPNVYHICQPGDPAEPTSELRAKYALLTLERFCRAMSRDFHSYFWARFAQPCEILYTRNDTIRDKLSTAFGVASASFIRRVLPAMGQRFSSSDLWIRGFSLTYQCELRTESSNRGSSIYAFNRVYYDRAIRSFFDQDDQLPSAGPGDGFHNPSTISARRFCKLTWGVRRLQGKVLSALRLLKAAFTFNEPLEYLLWKIERHSGLYIEPTARQLRHPLIFAWPLLWRLHKLGAFR